MEFKGTKGKWGVSNEPFTTLVTAKTSSGTTISVCSVTKCAETEADAKLIAAAPEMLEALESIKMLNLHLYKDGTVGHIVYTKVIDAIKKATE